jgi:hypothetical protein
MHQRQQSLEAAPHGSIILVINRGGVHIEAMLLMDGVACADVGEVSSHNNIGRRRGREHDPNARDISHTP